MKDVELISYFRPLLMKNTSSLGQENHTFLKHITGKLAVVKKLNGEKYVLYANEMVKNRVSFLINSYMKKDRDT